jgi:hypothetical protein
MTSNQNYETVKALFVRQSRRGSRSQYYYTRANQLLKLLLALGINAKIKRSKCWDDIGGVAIVGVHRKACGNFHWVVALKSAGRFLILDPKHGEILNGDVRADRSKRYSHSKRPSNYICIDLAAPKLLI